MKKLIVFLMGFVLLATSGVALAAKGGNKGPSDKAYEHANEHARFKRDENWKKEKKEKKKKKEKKEKKERKHKKEKKHKEESKESEEDKSDKDMDETPVNAVR